MADGKTSLSFKWIAGAAVAAVLAGAGAVYVTMAPSGNGGTQTADVDCPVNAERRAAIDAAATGEVAAFASADPENLSGLSFQGRDGKAMTLADFKGKTILVNLWATWCVPCRKEMPALNGLEQQLGGDEFQVVAINIDTGEPEKVDRFLDEVGVSALGRYSDSSMRIFNEFKKRSLALGLPATVLVDPKGCLLGKINGPAEWDSADAIGLIEAAMGGAAPAQ
ncbi:sodium:dicarboxylate symporter [Zhengella mangrovi]|uniref:Sodium:dicarboxylate symporter n=1 Tax=Zhengella mangrovi TaxID=1982044 RepID=A0A2G1QJB7_9HYPH|nr:TlpA disulfide reductase family protein [Zhengella mangrovi]PHP65550.1 sodium:dicarboxylate symporter [Zhengella mangrovi]